MNNIKFSVLIPVYNTEKYLSQCIESVTSQNYTNMEIILVDDGSNDKSSVICDKYALKDSRIKVIHKKNEGQLSSRIEALKNSTGEYVVYLDSDDYWDDNLLSTANHMINKHNCDMIIFNIKCVYNDKIICNAPLFTNEEIFENDSKKKLYELALGSSKLNSMCLSIISKKIIDSTIDFTCFFDMRYGEDAIQFSSYLINAKKMVYLSECFYNYRCHKESITGHITAKCLYDMTKLSSHLNNIYVKTSFDLSDAILKGYYNYMTTIPKYIIYGYLDSPKKTNSICKYVFDTNHYKRAKENTYNKLRLLDKIIINSAEKGSFKFVSIVASIVCFRNSIKRSIKKFINSKDNKRL